MKRKLLKYLGVFVTKITAPYRSFAAWFKSLYQKEEPNEEDEGDKKVDNHTCDISCKREHILRKLERVIYIKRLKNQCSCLHQDKNGINVRIAKKSLDEVIIECKACHKKIYVNKLNDATVARTIEAIDMMCDAIKMSLNLENEKDMKIANWIGEYQYNTIKNIRLLYNTAASKGSNK